MSNDFQQECQDYSVGERAVFLTSGLGNWVSICKKNEAGPLPDIIYKNKVNMDQRPKYKS